MPPKRRGPRPRPLLERFLRHVEKDPRTGCWLWTASLNDDNGYGAFRDTRPRPHTTVSAHRIAWELFRGPIPEGLWVLHTCEGQYPPRDFTYRRCVNPAHLKLGDVVENHRDLALTGRHRARAPQRGRRGEAHHNAVLSEGVVVEAVMWRRAGVTYAALARELGVDDETVREAVRGITWSHVKRPPEVV